MPRRPHGAFYFLLDRESFSWTRKNLGFGPKTLRTYVCVVCVCLCRLCTFIYELGRACVS